MNIDQIKTFLAVVDYGNISSAAENLFITQSNVSKRLRSLEDELGVELILRQKGIRNVRLTEYGIKYVPIARQMLTLLDSSNNLKNLEDVRTIRIVGADAANSFTLVPLFKEHIKKYPNIKLSISTHHSNEIYTQIENNEADIGFVFKKANYSFLLSRPVYRELMYLACKKGSKYYDGYDPSLLEAEKEVYLYWDHSFQEWHNQYINPTDNKLVTVNVGSMMQLYLDEIDNFAIAPISIIEAMRASKNNDIVYYRLKDSPPPRICYEVKRRNPDSYQENAIKTFEDELTAFVKANRYVCTYESWMGGDD